MTNLRLSTVRSIALALLAGLLCATWLTPAQAWAADNDPVWRLQVRLRTGSADSGGTDDPVTVRLNNHNATVLDHDRDDFERGSNRLYDLSWRNVYQLGAIQYLEVSKRGTDGWCLAELEFYVNGQSVLRQDFGQYCQWIDGNDGHRPSYTIGGTAIQRALQRNYDQQRAVNQVRNRVISLADLDLMLTSKIGNLIAGNDVRYWENEDGSGVVIQVKEQRYPHPVLAVDLDLKWSLNNATDPDVDVKFDLVFECKSGFIHATVRNVRQTIGFFAGTAGVINDGGRTFYDMDYKWPVGGACPGLDVLYGGDLRFRF